MGTVWILGAGFSRSLGGPLLTELFSQGSGLKVKTCFSKLPGLQGDDAKLARLLFNDNDGPRQWENAEEFLDYLDTAQLGGEAAPSYQALSEMIRGLRSKDDNFRTPLFAPLSTQALVAAKIKPIAEMSRRLLAAECSAFLVDADVHTEKWAPYVRWAHKVEPGDTIITFNYDLVVETLAKRVAATDPGSSGKFHFLCPPREGPVPRCVNVLKLHGSINWRQEPNPDDPERPRVFIVEKDDYFALGCREEEMVIASPGPSKFTISAGGALGPLWAGATQALKKADAIVFVGYRFPPTDSAARRILIDAIGENETSSLVLHTVLGPNVHDPAAERLKAMLEVAMERKGRWCDPATCPPKLGEGPPLAYALNPWPLWAEDFLDLCDPAKLYDHSRP